MNCRQARPRGVGPADLCLSQVRRVQPESASAARGKLAAPPVCPASDPETPNNKPQPTDPRTMPASKKGRKSHPIDDLSVQALAGPLGTLSDLFSAAQHNVSQHRKLINNTHALFLKCAKVTTTSEDGQSIRLSGEKLFGDAWRSMAVHALGVKKGVDQADKVVKFMAGFIGFAVEHGKPNITGPREPESR